MGLLYRRSTLTMQKQLFSTVISPKIFFPKTKGFFMCLIFSHLSINCSIKNHLETLPGERSQGWMLGYVAGFLKLCTKPQEREAMQMTLIDSSENKFCLK